MASLPNSSTDTRGMVSIDDCDNILNAEHLSVAFGGLLAVDDLSFTVKRGSITAIIGPNGAGKTTVFNCLTGFYKPLVGRIALKRRNGKHYLLERYPEHEICAKGKVARTFQNIRLFGAMTLLENLMVAQHLPLMAASGWTVGAILGLSSYRRREQQAIDRATYWLKQVGLVERGDDMAENLSYGDQRRLEIIRAMCTNPELLCLDEPAAGLNVRESKELSELILFIRQEHDTSILLIEHDMSVVMEISDRIVVIDYGKRIAVGAPGQIRDDPRVIAAYLGVDEDEQTDG